ncbi:MAG: hypothetical protein FWD49_07165 [Firmicutes bacterium]|nr:hypothetical protein [Bacillota bacterium]
MQNKETKCIMPEMPYCPSCPHGLIIYPEWAETIEDCEFCEWVCLLDRQEQ